METLMHAFKPYAEWVTGLRYKYRTDIFFRSTAYVIALQTALVIAAIASLSLALSYTNGEVVRAIEEHLQGVFSAREIGALVGQIAAIQDSSTLVVFGGIVVLVAFFGTLLAYATLRPARQTLQYQKLFISNIAHELRTPLSTIKTSTEVQLLDAELRPSTRKTLEGINTELSRISEIINNLLSLNRLLNPDQMEFTSVDLGKIIDHSAERLGEFARERGVEIVIKKEEFRTIWGNGTALEQVVTNLLKNAVSYTPQQEGLVTVSVGPDYKGSVLFTVADNGVGIHKRDLFHIFEPFYRADHSRNRATAKTGAGLGLAIVSEITRVHHGKIHIQSAPRKGTTVSIVFPSATVPLSVVAPEQRPVGSGEVSADFS